MHDESIRDRFWAKVRKTDHCWLWAGWRDQYGYGKLLNLDRRPPRAFRAHRLSWELHFGAVPAGLQVNHRCDVRLCVRPDHLFLGTQRDNVHDMWTKGRASPPPRTKVGHAGLHGEAAGRVAKLTAVDVRAIRDRYAAGGIKQSDLAAEYGLIQAHVSRIVRRVAWSHVP